jgi:hypothetical protein
MILSLLEALSAEVLETAIQAKMLYRMYKFGKPDNSESNCNGFINAYRCHSRAWFSFISLADGRKYLLLPMSDSPSTSSSTFSSS